MRKWLTAAAVAMVQAMCLAGPVTVLVTDEATGARIEGYSLWVYSPEGEWQGGSAAQDIWTPQPNQVPAQLRVVAAGYLPGESPVIQEDTQEVQIQLIPQKRVQATVIDRSGRPISGAQVSLVQHGKAVTIKDGKAINVAGEDSARTDDQGWFSLPLHGNMWGILVTHDSGAAFYIAPEFPDDMKLTIAPWARVEGMVAEHGKPAGGKQIAVESLFYNLKEYVVAAPAVTDEQGHYRIDQLLAKSGRLEEIWYNVGTFLRGNLEPPIAQRYHITAKPGQVARVQMDRHGPDVMGKVPMSKEIDWQASVVYLSIDLPSPKLPPGYEQFTREQEKAWWAEYEKSEEGQARKATAAAQPQGYQQATVAEDGSFRFVDVPPGKFHLGTDLRRRVMAGDLIQPQNAPTQPQIMRAIDVPPEKNGVQDGVLDLGDLRPE